MAEAYAAELPKCVITSFSLLTDVEKDEVMVDWRWR